MENCNVAPDDDVIRFEMIPHWIFKHSDITLPALRVYLSLKERSNDREESWPSRSTLARDCGMNVKTVDRALYVLLSINALKIEPRMNAKGDRTSNLYRLIWQPSSTPNVVPTPNIDRTPKVDRTPNRVPTVVPLRDGGSVTNVQRVAPQMVEELIHIELTHIEPTQIESIHENAGKKSKLDLSFDEFWSIYPRRSGKIKAKDAFRKASKECDPSEIIAGAQAFADDPNRQEEFTPHPATWLNQGRWEDDPLPERGSSERTKAEIQDDYFAKLDRETRQYDKERADAIARGQNFIDYSEWSRLKSSGDYRTDLGMVDNAFREGGDDDTRRGSADRAGSLRGDTKRPDA